MVVFLLAALIGLGLLAWARALSRRDEDAALAEVIGMAVAPSDDDDEAEAGHDDSLGGVTGLAVDIAGHAVERMDRAGSMVELLDRARIPLRPGEFVIVVGGAALGVAAVTMVLLGSLLPSFGAAIATVLVAVRVVRRRIVRRTKAFAAQLPDALSLVASSLSAGHTFLRAVQMMCEESAAPMSEEFSRLVAETRLGYDVTEALERMARRLQVRDLDMVVQAIRIQQTVGGKLADLFHTLSGVIRARDEVKREVLTLTAEGRMSAYVLAGLVPFLFLLLRLVNPEYVTPLYSGTGLVLLIGCGLSVVTGLFVILRMVKIEV